MQIDLLIIGVAAAATIILGFVVYFNNPSLLRSKLFLLFSLITVVWGFSNYFNYHLDPSTPHTIVLWILRTHLFISTAHALSFFTLAYAIAKDDARFPRWFFLFVLPASAVTAILTLTPLMFKDVLISPNFFEAVQVTRAPGILLFGVMSMGLVIVGIYFLLRSALHTSGEQKVQLVTILSGALLTFLLILTFNLVLPLVFNILIFIPLGAVALLPFIFGATYAIVRHHFLNIEILATETLAFILASSVFSQIIFTENVADRIIQTGIFLLVLLFSILLIRSVIREVEAREKVEQLAKTLEKANLQLEELNRQKSEFVSIASHQLQSPLTAIKGYLSMILDGTYGKITKEISDVAENMYAVSKRMIRSVEDFLTVSRIEQGRMEYDMKPCDMEELIQRTVVEFKPLLVQKKSKITFTTDAQAPYSVRVDEGKVTQVLFNLIDNAVKYSPEESTVRISLSKNEKNGTLQFSISDSGIGVAKDALPKLFERFLRTKRARGTSSGTGLGLFVAKQMVEAHGGRIWAESDGEGTGTTFFVELAIAQ